MDKSKIIVIVLCVLLIISIGALAVLMSKSSTNDDKRFKGIKIIFFTGGREGDSFSSVVYNGAKAAQEDLGCDVEYVYSDWNSDKMVAQFKDAIAKNPDAICVMGHPGEDALKPLIDEALRKGIIVTAQNVDLPTLRKTYAAQGFGYVGQDLYSSGTFLADGAIKKFNLKSGDKAIIFGPYGENFNRSTVDTNSRAMRGVGVMDTMEKAGIIVYAVNLPDSVNADAFTGDKMVSDALVKYPDAKVLVADHGQLTGAMPAILKKLGKSPGEYIVIGFDLSTDTVAGLRDGYIGLVHDQQPYLQGYLPILQASLAKKYGFSGLYIDTGVGLIDSSNVETVAKLAEQKIR